MSKEPAIYKVPGNKIALAVIDGQIVTTPCELPSNVKVMTKAKDVIKYVKEACGVTLTVQQLGRYIYNSEWAC